MAEARTYGTLTLDPVARQWVATDVAPHVALRIKDVFRRVSKTAAGEFRFADDELHCHELLWFMDRFPLSCRPFERVRLKSGRRRFETTNRDIERILLPDYAPPVRAGLSDGCALWPYQGQAVEVVALRKRLLLGDDIGLGKTNSAIGCMLVEGTLPTAVVVQAHLPDQWKERIEDFSSLKAHVIRSVAPYTLPPADVYIFTYRKLQGWVDFFRTAFFRFVALDEPQELRGGFETMKGQAAKVLCEAAGFVIGLTATPVVNYGIEMFRVMEFIAPGLLGTEEEFLREWCDEHGVVRDPDALGAFLRDQHVLLRRTEEDVGRQMPRPNITTHHVPYDEEVAARSEDLAVRLALKASSGGFAERGQAYRELDLLTRHTTGVAKAKGVAEYARILLEADLPVLLAGWHREVWDIWNEELADFSPVMYTGTESKARKRAAKLDFVSGRSPLMFISLRSGAGLDGLQHRCRDLVVGELDWSPTIHKQLIGRLRRAGQLEQVNVHYMIAMGGSDPLMVEVLGLKASQDHGIMNPYTAPPVAVSDESRMRRLAEYVLARRAAAAA